MSLQNKKLRLIERRVGGLRQKELREIRREKRWVAKAQRWFWMLYHEVLRDDVIIRAQSLAYLMIFSLLPLIAGAFFIFTFFAQFGMVQDAVQGMVNNFLHNIPVEHRGFINEYILKFKDAYLADITSKSSSVGIFALLILGWIGLQTFNNVDATLNYIWSADRSRPLLEQIRNFIVVAVVAPIVLLGGFSIPLILQKFALTRYFFERFPVLGIFLNYIIPPLLVLGIFVVMYRYVPVRRVWWKAAFWGALCATVALELVNMVMRIYFAYGTHTAYGKAAALPLVGFWIYVLWLVVILGAEISFLIQNGKDLLVNVEETHSLRSGRGLLAALSELYRRYQRGLGPANFEQLREAADVDSEELKCIIDFLSHQGIALQCASNEGQTACYSLGKSVDGLPLSTVLQDFFQTQAADSTSLVDKAWKKSLGHWTGYFEKLTVADLVK